MAKPESVVTPDMSEKLSRELRVGDRVWVDDYLESRLVSPALC